MPASTSDNMENSSSEDEIPASDIMLISTQHGNDVVNSGTIALDKLFDEEQHPTATESNTCCPFLSVPNEIILLFVEKGSLDRNSLRDLALTSSRLFQVTRPIFYKGYNYEAFRRAVNQFDVAAMERCALFDAAPVDFEWNVPSPCWVYSDDSDDILERGWTKTPLATLVSGFITVFSVEALPSSLSAESNRHNAVRWLLDHGADPNKSSPPFFCYCRQRGVSQCDQSRPVIFHLLPWLLKEGIPRFRIDTMSRLVSLLCARGAVMPLKLDQFPVLNENRTHYPIDMTEVSTVLELGLLLHSPPSILECLLINLERRGLSLTTRNPDQVLS